jgi:hypothetical protein
MERRAQRYTVWLPVRIEEHEDGMAVSHNASGRGMLIVTASQLEVGSSVTIVVQIPPEGSAEARVHGKVVRVEANDDDPDGMWPNRIAIEFDGSVPEIEKALQSLVEAGLAYAQR